MKILRTILLCVAIAALVFASIVFSSCSNVADGENSGNGKAYIRFYASAAAKTAFPTVTTDDFISLVLSGTDSENSSTFNTSWSSYSEMTNSRIAITEGSWTFTLTATTSGGTVYLGTTTATISSGNNSLSFELSAQSYGSNTTGTLNFTLKYPTDSGVEVVKAGLFTYSSDSKSYSSVSDYEEEELSSSDSTNSTSDTSATGTTSATESDETVDTPSAVYSKTDVSAGNYYLIYSFYADSDCSVKLGGYRELVYIAGGLTTEKTVTLTSLNSLYNITYETNDGTLTGSFPASYSVYSTITLPTSTEMTKTDCKFGGWYTTSGFTGTAITKIAKGTSGNITLYAKWYAVESISAVLADSSYYELASSSMTAPDISCFTITKTYEDNTTSTETPSSTTSTITSDGTTVTTDDTTTASYTVALPTDVTSNFVGNIPVTITLTSTANNTTPVTCTVSVLYKYKMEALESCKAYAASSSVAQYTGTTTLSTECLSSSYTVYGSSTTITDTLSYQWYSATSSSTTGGTAISGATSSTYTTPTQTAAVYYYCVMTTVCGGSDYCANASDTLSSTSNSIEVAVVPYTMTFTKSDDTTPTYTLSSGQSVSLTQAASYTLALVNSADSTAGTRTDITWSGATGFTLAQSTEDKSSWTLTAPTTTTGANLTATCGTSNLISVTIGTAATTLTLSSIAVTYNGSGITAGTDTTTLPDLSSFTVVKNYDDSTTTTDSTATSDKYSIAWGSDSWTTTTVGSRTLTVTSKELSSVTTTVSIPYKYAMVAPTSNTVNASLSSIAQYTGTTTLTATCATGFTTYTANDESSTSITDTLSYQWYSNTNCDNITGTVISGATSETYTVSAQEEEGSVYYYCVATTSCGNSTYCSNSTDSLTSSSDAIGITVSPWTMTLTDTTASSSAVSLSSGADASLIAGDTYTMAFANTGADSTGLGLANSSAYVSWTIGTEGFTTVSTGTSSWTFTAPAATSAAQSCLFTATFTTGSSSYIIGKFTGTVAAEESSSDGSSDSTTTYTDYATLKNAIGAIASGSSGTFYVSGDMTTTSTTITVKGNITVLASADCTITRLSTFTGDAIFTVNNGATLTLGGTESKSLVLDGNSTNCTATYPLINSAGSLEIADNCTLQNNKNEGTSKLGGAIYEYCTTGTVPTLTISGGTIQNNSASSGGGIYILGGSSCTINYVLSGGTISSNTAGSNGGGVYIKLATGTLSGTTITENTANGTYANTAGGGGIYLTGTTTLNMTGGEITKNTTTGCGGGILINSAPTVTITGGTISGNTCSESSSSACIYGVFTLDGTSVTTQDTDITH